jgi:hypothetical protein
MPATSFFIDAEEAQPGRARQPNQPIGQQAAPSPGQMYPPGLVGRLFYM